MAKGYFNLNNLHIMDRLLTTKPKSTDDAPVYQ